MEANQPPRRPTGELYKYRCPAGSRWHLLPPEEVSWFSTSPRRCARPWLAERIPRQRPSGKLLEQETS